MSKKAKTTLSKAEEALRDYKAGGDRYDLLCSLRGQQSTLATLHQFFMNRNGDKILLPTLVGDDFDVVDTAACEYDTEDVACVHMFVLDSTVVMFLAHMTQEGGDAVALTCDRAHIEVSAWEDLEEEDDEDEDEEPKPKYRWMPVLMPTRVDYIGGGTGYWHERLAGYLSHLEPDADGLWRGEQVLAASRILTNDNYIPEELYARDESNSGPTHALVDPRLCPTCRSDLDPNSDNGRYGAAVLPLKEEVEKRKAGEGGRKLTQKEDHAINMYVSLLLQLYTTIPLDKLPAPGVLRRRKQRHPILLLRELVARDRASIKRRSSAKLTFIFKTATPDIFSCILCAL